PVLLLHGFPDSWHLWRHQIDALAGAGHRVVAPDLRGFGETDKPEGVDAYSITRAALGDVTALMDTLDLERAAVVGHDFGGALGWVVAMLAPERVTRLVAVSSGHPVAYTDAGLRQKQLSWYTLWFQFPGVAEEVLPRDDWAFFRGWAWNGAGPGDD